mmetsp:Transcript_123588/g.346070  ORF Transcript_123588/g.346070 Transcript_123588/m.346070 type:complete len:702 (-) Transcript_123588:170-2275(-)
MAFMARSLVAACALGLLHVGRAVTPVEKVIELLEKLEAQTEEEGKQEAAAYDKYACFCKEQVDEKQYQIEKSRAKIKKLDAEIGKLVSEITKLDQDIGELFHKIGGLEFDMSEAQRVRNFEHADYVAREADAAGAIDACKRAIAMLKASKAAMAGKTELEALVQVGAVAKVAVSMAIQLNLSGERLRSILDLAHQQPGEAAQYKYHSNHIIATLTDLLASFKGMKAQMDQDEFGAKAMYDKRRLAMKNEMQFSAKEKAEKEALVAKNTDEKEAKVADVNAETRDMHADHTFQVALTEECQKKAYLWDQRSSTRAMELTAISEAMEALKTGVAPNYKANKKLVGLQESRAGRSGHWAYVEDAARPASFLQLRSRGRGQAAERHAADRAGELLRGAGERLQSMSLIAMALKVSVAEDHFVKVRSLIKDLIERLEGQADTEATHKSFCDTEMKRATEDRDATQSEVEDLRARIAATASEVAQLQKEIAELSAGIAANVKAHKERMTLREAESIENYKTINEAGAGKAAVGQALQVLRSFYENNALLQYVPPNSDREGKTVSERAPEVIDAEYRGSQEASKGILGMLEVVLADFDRTMMMVTDAEQAAEDDFQTFQADLDRDTQSKEQSRTAKDGLLVDAQSALMTFQSSEMSASAQLKEIKRELERLHPMCIQGEETHEQRSAKRIAEIEALKEAHDILENWSK